MALPPFLQTFVDGPKLPKVVLGVVGVVAIAAGGYFVLISPVQVRVDALVAQRTQVTSELNQEITDLACEILGEDAILWLGDPHAPDGAEWPRAYMNSFGMTIGGGTSEILRNILGERVLGLPKSK